MLRRIYIDNYKSLVNFELSFDEINLFVGTNGSGKSAVFEVLLKLQQFVINQDKINDIFIDVSCTRWQTSPIQTFELTLDRESEKYTYELSIEHDPQKERARVKHERLRVNNNPLLSFENGEVQLYRDNYSQGPKYPFDWAFSAVGSIFSRSDNKKLTWFKEQLRRFYILKPIPPLMQEESRGKDQTLTFYSENFASWYDALSDDQSLPMRLTTKLREILPNFENFRFRAIAEKTRLLETAFRNEDEKTALWYRFKELSDGQRMLIFLYALLYSVNSEDTEYKPILCLDEPENYLALPEIQPWLVELYDQCRNGNIQALLISHHPEFLNYLLASPVGYWFDRAGNRPTRVQPIEAIDKEGISTAELVARGWLNNA